MCACNFSLGAEVVFLFFFSILWAVLQHASQGSPQQSSKWNSHQFSTSWRLRVSINTAAVHKPSGGKAHV